MIIRSRQDMPRRRTAQFAWSLLLAAAVGSTGCAGGHGGAGAKAPSGTQVQSPGYGSQGVAQNQQGQQFAVTDQPSSGGTSANRPKMNASAQQAYNAGLSAFQKGDLTGAKAQFKRATQADANAYQAYYSLGVVDERLGDNAGALSAYKRATSIVGDYEPAIVAYGVLLANTGQQSEAETFLSNEQAKYPKSAAITAGLAEVKSIEGNSAEAQRLAQEALKKNPNYRPAMLTIARDHYRNRRLDLALYTLKGILDGYGPENPPRDKNNASAHLLRGLIYKEQGQRKLAMDEFKTAVALRPDLVQARLQLAAYMMEAGNAAGAAPLLEGAIRYDKDNVLAHLNLGDAYRLLGRIGDAQKQLEWVLSKDPSMAQAHYDLGLLYLFSENIPGVTPMQAADKAISEFTQYQKLKPRGSAGAPDDTEELITRAKTKKALIKAKQQEQAQAATSASKSGSSGSMPAAGGSGSKAPAKSGSSGSMPAAGGSGSKAPAKSGSSGSLPPAGGTKK